MLRIPVRVALAACLASLLAACAFTRPPVERTVYALGAARAGAPAAQAKPATLRVRPLRAVPPYDGREFLYRKADGQLVADFHNAFAAGPAERVTAAVSEWLKTAGLFRAVLDPGISVDAPYALEGSVLAIYGDLREAARPAAVVDLQFYIVRSDPVGRELVLDRRLTERIPVADASAQAFAQGFDEALERILQRLEREIAALDLAA